MKSMKDAILDVYVDHPNLIENVAENHYNLYLDDQAFVSPSDWELIVAPGMTFAVRAFSR